MGGYGPSALDAGTPQLRLPARPYPPKCFQTQTRMSTKAAHISTQGNLFLVMALTKYRPVLESVLSGPSSLVFQSIL
jgi:hypothetical protein